MMRKYQSGNFQPLADHVGLLQNAIQFPWIQYAIGLEQNHYVSLPMGQLTIIDMITAIQA